MEYTSRWVSRKFSILATAQARRDRQEQLRLENYADEVALRAMQETLITLWLMKLEGMTWSAYTNFLCRIGIISYPIYKESE